MPEEQAKDKVKTLDFQRIDETPSKRRTVAKDGGRSLEYLRRIGQKWYLG